MQTIVAYVENKPGVLNRVASLGAAPGHQY